MSGARAFRRRLARRTAAGAAAGHDARIGLKDALLLPDGRVASGNAELVAAALELVVLRS